MMLFLALLAGTLLAFLFVFYILFLVYAGRILQQVQDPMPSRQLLFVSIIVAVHNAEQDVRNCLDHLLNQEYPPDLYEVIMVADRCRDATEQIINTYLPLNPRLKLISIHETKTGFAPKKLAIDTAVAQAGGEIILLTDVDGRPGPRWVKSMASVFQSSTGMVLGYAPYITDKPYHTFIYRLLALEYLSHAAVAAITTIWGYPLTCVGTNLAYRKCVYKELNGFGKYRSYLSGDDDLFLQRVREESKWSIAYAHSRDAQVLNAPPRSFSQFYQQRLRYASKGFIYPFQVTIYLICFYLLNLLLLLSTFSLFWMPKFIFALGIIWIIKIIAESHFIRQAARYLMDTRYVKLLPLVSLLHVPYVVYFGLISQLQQYKWGDLEGKVN